SKDIVRFRELDLKGLDPKEISAYEFGAGEKKLLLQASVESIYRRSRKQVCLVVDLESQQTYLVNEGNKVTNPTLSPEGGHLGYVYENNLYLVDLEQKTESHITFDGKMNHIINGLTDWVYEEEFAIVQGFAFSPDGNRIAFYRFDETEVPQFSLPIYGTLYPELQTFKYPKAGESNAMVSIHVYDRETGETVMADLGKEKDQYVPRIKWTQSSKELAVMRLNRLQNKLDFMLVDASNGSSKVVMTEQSDTYINEVTDHKWFFLENSEDFLWVSEENGYNHIYRYNREGKKIKALTKGKWEVSDVLGVDEANDRIYYTSTEASSLQRQLYSISLEGKKKQRLTKEDGHHRIQPSGKFTYFVDTYSSQNEVPRARLLDAKGKIVKVLVDNSALQQRVEKLAIRPPEFFNCPLPGGETLNGWMIKPHDFDPAKEYPVLMHVYGGPGSQEVMDAWGHGSAFNYIWFQMLAQQGYLVACVDNRGTGGRGQDFRAVTYADLGKYEVEDQVDAAKYLGSLPYVDANRIGIWGWSYGGYMSSLCLTKGGGVFKMGIAVAPVTNWRFY
ncbi:MAG: DPP IV N-terminal domain-containing protein, partial [Bacteroidota bacterium]